MQEEPYAMSKGSELEGFCIDLLSAVSKKLDFKYDIKLVKDGRYGTTDDSGNWNGMIGEVVRGWVSFIFGVKSCISMFKCCNLEIFIIYRNI